MKNIDNDRMLGILQSLMRNDLGSARLVYNAAIFFNHGSNVDLLYYNCDIIKSD